MHQAHNNWKGIDHVIKDNAGAAAALVAASQLPALIEAVVSRGGRPDLADSALSHVL